MKFVREQFFLAAAAQNVKRLVRFLSQQLNGGLLIMMGQHDRSEALFYYFRLEDQVPETHLLRLIERHISFR